MAGQTNTVASAPRKDPYYRPGGTSDYIPATRTPAATADRYNNPAVGYSHEDPYMPADASKSPATGGSMY